MELRQLRYFLAVAQCEHFTRAAEQLGIAQPPLSRQIKLLEEEIGTHLFIRYPRGVKLTPAGEQLQIRAQQILNDTNRAISEVQSMARGITGHLSLGFAGSVAFHSMISKKIRAYREKYPEVKITSYESDSMLLVDRVAEARIDCAFVRKPLDCGDLSEFIITDEPLVVVVPEHHQLSQEKQISLPQLANYPFVAFPRNIGVQLYDHLIALCKDAGFTPNIAMEAPQISSVMNMVAAGFGISLVPASMHCIQLPSIRFIPLALPTHSSIAFIYRPYKHSILVKNMLSILQDRQH